MTHPTNASHAPDSFTPPHPSSRITRRMIAAWGSWDWGAAAFNAVLVTFIFSVYLTDSVGTVMGSEAAASSAYSYVIAASGVIIAISAPAMGRRSDLLGTRRRSLTLWSWVTVLCMAALFFIRNDSTSTIFFWLGCAILGLASITYQFAEVNYSAQLKQISHPHNVGRISSFGWSLGYFGGIILLLLCYFGFISGTGGLLHVSTTAGLNIRLVALLAAAWFALFSLPTMLTIPEIPRQLPHDHKAPGFLASYKDVGRQIAHVWRTDRNAIFFLIASAVFRDGLAGVFSFGAILAVTVYGVGKDDVILFGVAANVISAIGALISGILDDAFGPKPVIVGSLIFMLCDAAILFFVDGPRNFWIFGLILCLFVGPAQTASRTFLSRMTSNDTAGEMFGLYATTGRAVSWMAPAAFGLAVSALGSSRDGILGIMAVLALGLILLAGVKQPQSFTTKNRQTPGSSESRA